MSGSTGLYSYPSGVAVAMNSHTMRPVINLKPTTAITNGNGTIDSPYIIKID